MMLFLDLIDGFGSNHQIIVAVSFVLLLFYLHHTLTQTDIPRIAGIKEIPGALPITGHLLALGDDHATVCEKWWRDYKQSIFQIRLGNTRAVVVNSFDDCRKMLVGHQSAVIDRPKVRQTPPDKMSLLTTSSYTPSMASFLQRKASRLGRHRGTRAARTSVKLLARLWDVQR